MHKPRHIKLSAEHTGAVRFLSGLHVNLEEDKPTSWVTLTRTGSFTDPRYGTFAITGAMLLAMVNNFNKGVFGQDVFIDVAHRPNDGAAAKVLKLTVEGERLRAFCEWTPFGVDAIKNKGYRYLSLEYHESWKDNEKGADHGCVMLGAGLCVRPVIKRLDPVQLSVSDEDGIAVLLHPSLQTTLLQELDTMHKDALAKLKAKLEAKKLAAPVIAALMEAAEKSVIHLSDASQAQTLLDSFEQSGIKLAEEIGDKVVTLSINAPAPAAAAPGLTQEAVIALMAEQNQLAATTAKQLAEKKAANVKLLADTIGAATGFDDVMKKSLTDTVSDLITADMTEENVRRLADLQIKNGNELVVARQLTALGYPGAVGNVHITVDSSNQVKSLQAQVDKRLGFEGMDDAQRYVNTGGQLQRANKELADKVLAQFDAIHGARLAAEHKQLAAGTGSVSDVSVPAIFERTVIREALYSIIGLQFVDVGTAGFSATLQLPYSYRDTSAAGRGNTRSYEAQGIRRSGIIQTFEETRPIPQKLSFRVSDELRLLAANGQLSDFDIVIENMRNATRIIAEDTEKLIFDEVLNSNDEYGAISVAAEALTGVNGTNAVFVLANFPVVRPRKVFDLKGAQQGATLNPIVVMYAGSAKSEFDGSGTQPAGTYYVLDYNLGEIRFVSEAGAPVLPANATAITVAYSKATNALRFDTDLGSLAAPAKWDDFLYRFGLRKDVIESQRYFSANYSLMSGTVRTMIEQASQFGANNKRNGTDLSADGNLGKIKDVPGFKSSAPGLMMGDQRLVIGQRANTRFRMLKPWAMEELENARDSGGNFTGQKEAYGTQFIALLTPALLKGATTSVALYSSSARVNRAS
ncbi:phage protease [Herminiimonas contaminans]|uniref:Mu-like prophage I protein n=1 Tax=Herminiimonas contaminans TaxID=1111140 RepID=A0ABS0EXT7_9BURK|nr:phage protease [Herminiimonas contaminans]MBF8179652.1 hypothetical protein [Herminiimonas contaminans]